MDVSQVEPARVLGWTWDQWALVCGRFDVARVATLNEALKLRRQWKRSNSAEPGEVELEGVENPLCHEAAADVFNLPLPGRPMR